MLRYKYFRFSGHHLELIISGYFNPYRREFELLTYSLSYVFQMFLIEQYAFDRQYRDGNKKLPKIVKN